MPEFLFLYFRWADDDANISTAEKKQETSNYSHFLVYLVVIALLIQQQKNQQAKSSILCAPQLYQKIYRNETVCSSQLMMTLLTSKHFASLNNFGAHKLFFDLPLFLSLNLPDFITQCAYFLSCAIAEMKFLKLFRISN